jgi:para-nitrobenzyl esterase
MKRRMVKPGDSARLVDRRSALTLALSAAAGTAVLAASPARAQTSAQTRSTNGDDRLTTTEAEVVKLARARLEAIGVTADDLQGHPLRGFHSESRSFPPPQPVAPWSGVRSTRAYGQVCPQPPRAGRANDQEAFMMRWDDGQPGEDCLRVNVWTPDPRSGRRPVMVWLHGGGFTAGSGQELPAYDGENLARRGDVVVVSVNHRLGPLGFLNLSATDPDFADSANAGMLDLVASLKWVRDNISAFGGDPGNVTIFGQSGGAKVSTLLAMPSAKVSSGRSFRAARATVGRGKGRQTAETL